MSSEFINPISYSRRSPWPIINILRSPQVNAVQKGVPEGKVFYKNKEALSLIGSEVLQKMLDARDWSALPINAPYLKAVLANQYTSKEKQEEQPQEAEKEEEEVEIITEVESVQADNAVEPLPNAIESFYRKSEEGSPMSPEEYRAFAENIDKWLLENE